MGDVREGCGKDVPRVLSPNTWKAGALRTPSPRCPRHWVAGRGRVAAQCLGLPWATHSGPGSRVLAAPPGCSQLPSSPGQDKGAAQWRGHWRQVLGEAGAELRRRHHEGRPVCHRAPGGCWALHPWGPLGRGASATRACPTWWPLEFKAALEDLSCPSPYRWAPTSVPASRA